MMRINTLSLRASLAILVGWWVSTLDAGSLPEDFQPYGIVSDGKQEIPTWKKINPRLEDAPTTWDLILGLAETGRTTESWQVFNRLVAPRVEDPLDLIDLKIMIHSAAGETTPALQLTSNLIEIPKQRNVGKKDRFGHDLTKFDYKIDASLGAFYDHHNLPEKALTVYRDVLDRHLATVEDLATSLSKEKAAEFEADGLIWTEAYYQQIALLCERTKDYENARAACEKMLKCAEAYAPPESERYPVEQTKRVKSSMRAGAKMLMDRINREMQKDRSGISK